MRLLLLTILVGCSTPDIKVENDDKVDSVIKQSQKNFFSADSVSRQSDSLINKKVTKAVEQITTLKQEVKILKQENNALKVKLDDATDGGKPFQLLPVSSSKNDR
jgi:hypothetical protein